MERSSRRSFQIQSKDDITEEAKVIRLRTSGRQYETEELLSADLTNLLLLLVSKAYTFHPMSRWTPDVVALWIA